MIDRSATRAHPDDLVDPARSPERRRVVTVNLAESPLAWLHARGHLSERQFRAGERLRADFERAGLSPSITMRWDGSPPSRSARGPSGHGAASLAQIDAHRRFDAAVTAAGPGLADICWRVICAGEPMQGAERALGWPARSGRVVLTLALDRLADHYGC